MIHASLAFGRETYVERRKELCKNVTAGKILLLGNKHSPRNFKDNYYRFRQDSTFLYYIGIDKPNLHALIDTSDNSTILFGNESSIDEIVWTGQKPKIAEQAEKSGISKVQPLSQLQSHLNGFIHHLPPYRADHSKILTTLLGSDKITPSESLRLAVIKQRNIKSAEEIKEIEKAVKLSGEMHKAVMKACKPGLHEYDLVSVASKFAWNNQVKWSYQPILTTDGEILHNHNYSNQIDEDQMILFDGGIEVESGYCGDITRTFPSGEHFTTLQKEIYQIVLSAYDSAVALAGPGRSYKEIHLIAAEFLVHGLIALGWMKGLAEEAVAAGAHTMFFQCGLGHMMGLDVHDMENLGEEYVGYAQPTDKSKEFGLKSLRLGRNLEAGHCITIEPGIYVIPALIEKFKSEGKYTDFINYDVLTKNKDFGGIRIEDNFIITEKGNRILDGSLPKDIESIEAIKASHVQHL